MGQSQDSKYISMILICTPLNLHFSSDINQILGTTSSVKDAGLKTVKNWPMPETAAKFGQLSSVAFDVYGNVVVFHRGDRTWNGFTFDR